MFVYDQLRFSGGVTSSHKIAQLLNRESETQSNIQSCFLSYTADE